MEQPARWRQMASAPRDGSRILVTVRPVEQGPAEVDVAFWARGGLLSRLHHHVRRARVEMLDAVARRQSRQECHRRHAVAVARRGRRAARRIRNLNLHRLIARVRQTRAHCLE